MRMEERRVFNTRRHSQKVTPDGARHKHEHERTLPKTGCADSDDGSNQSKKLLFATFKKNCDPPDCGAPIKQRKDETNEME